MKIIFIFVLFLSPISWAQEQKSCKEEFNEITRSFVQQGVAVQEAFFDSLRNFANPYGSKEEWRTPVPLQTSIKWNEFFERCLR